MDLSPPSFSPPVGYSRIRVVKSFNELVTTPFGNGVNALCWQRTLAGNFNEVVAHLAATEDDIATLDDADLRALPLSDEGRVAVETLIADLQSLRALNISPVLNCIQRYPRDEEGGVVPTDVYSFHVDSASVETDTYLCSYTESSSEGLRNEEAQRFVDIPEFRAQLLKSFGGEDNEEFLEYLRDNCYDLHYAPTPQAQPFSFGLGNMWRIAVDYPGSPVPPCVHRAPETISGRPPRLLLIS
jgi:hypothetical protein